MMQALATASPQGDVIAYVAETFLFLQSLRTHRTQRISIDRKLQANAVRSLTWSESGSTVIVLRDESVAVVNVLPELKVAATLDNGSGGLGHFVSATWLGDDQVLVIWEFGRAQIWNVTSGTSIQLPDAKSILQGPPAHLRPTATGHGSTALLALLSRTGADDVLMLYLPTVAQLKATVKLPTLDVQTLSWSPDGRWLAVLDTPSSSVNLHILPPEGHVYRSLPLISDPMESGLGLRSITWSLDGRYLALARHDGHVELLNTRTFSPIATFQHTTTIDQSDAAEDDRAMIWQESVSASNARSFSGSTVNVSPPLSRSKQSTEPDELGITEVRFNSNGAYLATRDSRTLTTVWLWDISRMKLQTVLIMHSNVRKLSWHPNEPHLLLIDCADGVAQILDVLARHPPISQPTGCKPKATLHWLPRPKSARRVILATEKLAFKLLFPDGSDDLDQSVGAGGSIADRLSVGGEDEEDSLLDVLSGRKPLPPKTEPSFTERIDMAANAGDDSFTGQLDDTFREKIKAKHDETDPLDDSDIF